MVKVSSYVRIILGLWVFSGLLLFIHPVAYYVTTPPGTMDGLSRMHEGGAAGPTLLGGVLFGIVAPIVLALLHRPTRMHTLAAFNQLDYLLPRTRREFMLFAAVSLFAGIGEEVIYRGFLIRYFQGATWGFPLWAFLVASCLIFGVAHAGQGGKGIFATCAAGLQARERSPRSVLSCSRPAIVR